MEVAIIDGEEYAYESIEDIRKKQIAKYELYLRKSNIPEFYWKIDFEHYKGNQESKEFKDIVYYAENCHIEEFNHVHLFLYGNHSTQKSALMYNIGKQAIKNGLKVKSILAGNLIDKLMKLQGYSYIEEIYNELRELKECDLLLIDDFGDANKTIAWKGESKNLIIGAWDTFLREVFSSRTKIVMTSNYDTDFIQEYYGKSLFELLDRNFYSIQLTECIKEIRQYNVAKVFQKNIKRRKQCSQLPRPEGHGLQAIS